MVFIDASDKPKTRKVTVLQLIMFLLSCLIYFIPFGVDVCSGVESKKGVKDSFKLKKFIDLIKNYER